MLITSTPPAWHWKIIATLFVLLDPIAAMFAAQSVRPLRIDPRWDSPRRRRRGLIVVLGGIEGPSAYQTKMARGLVLGGWRGAVVVHRWNDGVWLLRVFSNLMDRARHERESDATVALIEDHWQRYPGTPVGLLSLSGGCWIAVKTLEKLRDGARVRCCTLLAPAISPYADLSRAAARCERGLVVVRGAGDSALLGLGTLLLGTADRVHSPAAGWLGFRQWPPGLVDFQWQPRFMAMGYFGNHTSSAARRFISRVVTPWYC